MTDVSNPGHALPPLALVESAPVRRGLGRLIWLVPVAAAALSIAFAYRALSDRGPTISLFAEHGHGIGPGDALRYLGIEVGEVASVGLGERGEAQEVRIEVRMMKDAATLARGGTSFWIVRPELSLDSVQGLETIIGAQYIALSPGPADAEPRTEFTVLAEPPLADGVNHRDGLEVVLEASTRFGLQPGAGISYRGVRIGSVTAVGLSSDATSVEVRALIRRAYAQLVRERSVFWETGGFEFGLSITAGLEVDLDSIRTALVGGIAMATPVDAGEPATRGMRFTLNADVDDEWLDWEPALPLGNDLLPPGAVLPKLLRATLTWTEGRVIKTKQSRAGWMCVEAEGLVGPTDLLAVPDDAREGRARLEVAGRVLDVGELAASGAIDARGPQLAVLKPTAFSDGWAELSAAHAEESLGLRRPLVEPEDLIVVREGGRAPIGISAARLSGGGDAMTVDSRIPLTEDWHGAVVMSRGDGAIVGFVLIAGNSKATIAPAL